MVDNRGAAKAASNAAPKVTEQQVVQDASWVGKRLKEPSTYAGLGVLLALIFHVANAPALAADIQTIGIALGTIILAVLAIVMPESRNKSVPPSVKTLAWFVILAAALAYAHPASAATRHSTKPTVSQVQQNPLLLLNQIATADLQAALADAQAQTCPATPPSTTPVPCPDTIAVNCYQALLNLKNSPAFSLPTGKPIGLFTGIQKGRDLKSQLAYLAAPNGPLANLNAACAAYNQDNLTTLVNIGVAAGLIANPAGATAAIASLPAQIAAFLAAIPK